VTTRPFKTKEQHSNLERKLQTTLNIHQDVVGPSLSNQVARCFNLDFRKLTNKTTPPAQSLHHQLLAMPVHERSFIFRRLHCHTCLQATHKPISIMMLMSLFFLFSRIIHGAIILMLFGHTRAITTRQNIVCECVNCSRGTSSTTDKDARRNPASKCSSLPLSLSLSLSLSIYIYIYIYIYINN